MSQAVNIKNKQADHFFDIIDEFTAGIILTGTEIKSVRQGKAGITDAYCYFRKGELWIKEIGRASCRERV